MGLKEFIGVVLKKRRVSKLECVFKSLVNAYNSKITLLQNFSEGKIDAAKFKKEFSTIINLDIAFGKTAKSLVAKSDDTKLKKDFSIWNVCLAEQNEIILRDGDFNQLVAKVQQESTILSLESEELSNLKEGNEIIDGSAIRENIQWLREKDFPVDEFPEGTRVLAQNLNSVDELLEKAHLNYNFHIFILIFHSFVRKNLIKSRGDLTFI